jgi:serine/threonine-protein kinase
VPAGFGGDERYRSYDSEVRTGRAWWPWLLAVGVAIALGIAGWFVYDDVRDRIDANEPVAVDNYTGILEQNAVDLIVGDGFEAKVVRRPNADVQPRYVFQQEPEPGTRLPKDSIVTVIVSTGKPKVSVPFVVGKSRDTAVAELTQRDLEATVVEVNSERQSGIVTAQNPRAGTVLVSGASVRINVSKGPKPIAVPSVVGATYELAAAQLQSAGFTVGRVDVESNETAGTVVSQNPPGNSTATRGSPVTLSVSRGPSTVSVPDVSFQSVADARATLRAAGFRVAVTRQETDDETLDGVVISQDPPASSQADPDALVTLTVGTYVPPPDVTTPPTTTSPDQTTTTP